MEYYREDERFHKWFCEEVWEFVRWIIGFLGFMIGVVGKSRVERFNFFFFKV